MTTQIAREETRCHHMGYSFRLTARVLLYAPSHRQHSTYHRLCYTSRGALAGTRNSSMGPPHEGSIRWPIEPWGNTLTTDLHLAPRFFYMHHPTDRITHTTAFVIYWHEYLVKFNVWLYHVTYLMFMSRKLELVL